MARGKDRKWRATLCCSAAKAFATSLLELRGGLGADGDTLPSHEVESTSRYGAVGFLSHFVCQRSLGFACSN